MNPPLISIVIPIFNSAKYLGQCIESVISQNYSKIEIILVDDGSTDDSVQLCDTFAAKDPKRIKVIHAANGGTVRARELGWKNANGSYIGFVDSDDWVDEDYIESLVRPIKENPEIDIVAGRYKKESKAGSSVSEYRDDAGITTVEKAIEILFDFNNTGWSAWGKLYSRKVLESITRWWSYESYGDDTELNWKALHAARKICFINDKKYHFRVNDQSLTHAGISERYVGYIIRYERIMEELRESEADRYLGMAEHIFRASYGYLLQMMQISGYSEDITKRCHRVLRESINYIVETEKNTFAYQTAKASFSSLTNLFTQQGNELIRMLAEFCKQNETYIYGKGTYGLYLEKVLQDNAIPFSGFVVTKKKDAYDPGVYSLEELIDGKQMKPNTKVGVVIAMNAKNARSLPMDVINSNHIEIMKIEYALGILKYMGKQV